MKRNYGILVCETLSREVAAAIDKNGIDSVEVITFPCDCARPSDQTDRFDTVMLRAAKRFDHLLLLGSPCFKQPRFTVTTSALNNITRIERCFDLFLPSPYIEHLIMEGAYLLTPGWLDTWEDRIKVWGFDKSTCRDFFAESCAKLVLLDTGSGEGSPEKLAALAAFVDRPWEILPVGLDLLQLVLKKHGQDWSFQSGTNSQAPEAPQLSADFAMVFDVLSSLVGLESEDQVVRAIFDLFDMICAPGLQVCLPFRDGNAGTLLTNPPATPLSEGLAAKLSGIMEKYAWSESGAGFVIHLQQGNEPLAVLLLEGFALPQHKESYLNLALTILPVLVLAISNARNYEQKEISRKLLEEEHRQLQQAFDEIRTLRGIVPICAYCKKVRDDKGYWEQVEQYVTAHTEARFSHGICPICFEKQMKELKA